MPGAQLRAGVTGQVGVAEVVGHREQDRGRQQHAGDGAEPDPGRVAAQVGARHAAGAPGDPHDGEQQVGVGDLGETRVGGERHRRRDQPPAPAPPRRGRVARPLDPEQQHRQERQRVDGRVGEPRELAVERERDRPGDRGRAPDADAPQQAVGADPGDQLQQHVLVELAVGEHHEQRRREQRRGLGLAEQRHPGALVWVPPGPVQVHEVERGEMADRLRVEPVARVDRRPAPEQPGRERLAQLRAADERVQVDEPDERGQVRQDDRGGDREQRHGVWLCPQHRPAPGPRTHTWRVSRGGLRHGFRMRRL